MKCWLLPIVFFTSLHAAQLTPEEIVRRSVAVNERDWQQAPSFTVHDRTIEKKDDQTTDRTYVVVMMEGSPYRRLVAIDGQPLAPAKQRQEDQKERHELARRRSETSDERETRIRKYQRERDQDHMLMMQMANAFKFRLIGEDSLSGHPVYVLDAEPNPDYKPVNHEAKVLTGMRGKLWIDKAQYHWAKVEAEVIHPVTFGGFLAKVGPGTKFVLAKEPVSGDVWQPKEFSVQVCASILFWAHNSSTTDQFSDYRSAATTVASVGKPSKPHP